MENIEKQIGANPWCSRVPSAGSSLIYHIQELFHVKDAHMLPSAIAVM